MKTTYKDNKGDGKFTGLGTFVTDSEGFISFNIAETDDKESGKLKFTGVFYLVGKKESGSDWEIKYKKTINGEKKADNNQLDSYFPKPASDLPEATQSYGGFIENKENDFQKICSSEDCRKESVIQPITKKVGTWKKTDDPKKKLECGAENLTWGTTFYTDEHWKLSDKIGSFQGTGTSSDESKTQTQNPQ